VSIDTFRARTYQVHFEPVLVTVVGQVNDASCLQAAREALQHVNGGVQVQVLVDGRVNYVHVQARTEDVQVRTLPEPTNNERGFDL
jgi:hypothetical protein